MRRSSHDPQSFNPQSFHGLQLLHFFASGLRFDTEVQYLVWGARRYQFVDLPTKPMGAFANDPCLFGLIQCAAVLTQQSMAFTQSALAVASCKKLKSLIAAGEPMAFTGAGLNAQALVSHRADQIGLAALQSMRNGQTCLLGFVTKQTKRAQTRWAMVTGVEVLARTGPSKTQGALAPVLPRALLVLDAQTSEPWACGHNARIELLPGEGHLHYRALTGEAAMVQIKVLLTLRQQEPQ